MPELARKVYCGMKYVDTLIKNTALGSLWILCFCTMNVSGTINKWIRLEMVTLYKLAAMGVCALTFIQQAT